MSIHPSPAPLPERRDPSLQTGMFAVLGALLAHAQGVVAGRDGGTAAEAPGRPAMPRIEGRELLRTLGRLQRGEDAGLGPQEVAELGPVLREAGNLQNVLRRLRSTRFGERLAPFDATMLELVAMLYDGLFEDPRIPGALKGLLGRMQLTVLRAALTDKALFDGGPHPVRRLVDSIGQLGLRLPRDLGASSAVFPVIAATVDELVRRFDDDLGAFDSARVRIDALVVSEDARLATQMRKAETELDYVESLDPFPGDQARTWPLPAGMEVGAWIAVEEEDSRFARHARLHYVSPMKTRFLFVDRRGNKVFEGSRAMLVRRLQLGEVVLLASEPDPSLFDRALKRIVARLRDRPAPELPLRRRMDRQAR